MDPFIHGLLVSVRGLCDAVREELCDLFIRIAEPAEDLHGISAAERGRDGTEPLDGLHVEWRAGHFIRVTAPEIDVFDIAVRKRLLVFGHVSKMHIFDGGEIQISSHRSAFTLVSNIQEEVHRFAITYHRKKHQKSSFSSGLLKIDGIGEKKAKALLKHFKTIANIKAATEEELCSVEGISPRNAQDIAKYYQNY